MENNNFYEELGKICIDFIVVVFKLFSYLAIACVIMCGIPITAFLLVWYSYGYITYPIVIAVIWPMVVSLILFKISINFSNNQDNKRYETLRRSIAEEKQMGYMA